MHAAAERLCPLGNRVVKVSENGFLATHSVPQHSVPQHGVPPTVCHQPTVCHIHCATLSERVACLQRALDELMCVSSMDLRSRIWTAALQLLTIPPAMPSTLDKCALYPLLATVNPRISTHTSLQRPATPDELPCMVYAGMALHAAQAFGRAAIWNPDYKAVLTDQKLQLQSSAHLLSGSSRTAALAIAAQLHVCLHIHA